MMIMWVNINYAFSLDLFERQLTIFESKNNKNVLWGL